MNEKIKKVEKVLEEGEVKYIRDSRSYQDKVYYVVIDFEGNKLLCQGFSIKGDSEIMINQAPNDKKTRKWLVTKGEVRLENVISYSISPFIENPYWGLNEQEIIEIKNIKGLHSLEDNDDDEELSEEDKEYQN